MERYWKNGATDKTKRKLSASQKKYYKEHPEARVRRSESLKISHKEHPECWESSRKKVSEKKKEW